MPVTRLADSTLADTIRAGLRPNEAPWPLPPLIFEPEHWSAAPAEVAAKLIEGLARHVAGEGHWLNCEPLSRVRTLPLLCYREGKLCEAQTRTFEGRRALVTFIACDAGTFVLTGQSRPLHALNIAGPKIDLSEPENATQYLKLFCAAVQGEEGPFRIVERLDDFQLSRPFTDAERGSIAAKVSAVGEPRRKVGEEGWLARANVAYGGALFASDFEIQPAGMVQMLDDDPLVQDLGFRPIRIRGLLRADWS